MLSIGREDQERITKQWLQRTLLAYPPQSLAFFLHEKDKFRNPVGHAFAEQLPAIVEELMGGMDRARLSNAIETIVRIRAIQDFAPGRAIAFLFELKSVLREGFMGREEDRIVVEERIDEAVLLAFDLYMACREKIYEVKAEEAKRRVARLERIYAEVEMR